MAASTWVTLPGCEVRCPQDAIAAGLSVPGSGWFIEDEEHCRQLLLGGLDHVIVSTVKSGKLGRLALAVSSVRPGICLGPALNLAVAALDDGQHSGPPPLARVHDRIAIVSRSHAIRDYLAESDLRFGSECFAFLQFPTYRLKRDGTLEIARFGRRKEGRRLKRFNETPEFVVHDLSPLEHGISLPECRVVIAELAELDSRMFVERFFDFIRESRARYVFAIISQHDAHKRAMLEEHGFAVVPIMAGAGNDQPDLSFSALQMATPDHVKFTVTSCVEPTSPVAILVDRAYRMLRELRWCCGDGPVPQQLNIAWRSLDELANAPASLSTIEAVRKGMFGQQTLKFTLDKLHRVNLDALSATTQTALRLRWPHLPEALLEVYNAIERYNPVAEQVIERIVDGKQPLAVVVKSRSAAAALRRELLFGFGLNSEDLPVIGTASELCRSQTLARNLLILGFDPVYRPEVYWSLLPSEIEVLSYPHAIDGLSKYQSKLQHDATEEWPKENRRFFESLVGRSNWRPATQRIFDLDVVDNSGLIREFAQLRRSSSTLRKERSDVIEDSEIDLGDIVVPDGLSDREDGASDRGVDGFEGPRVRIPFVGGSVREFYADSWLAVLPGNSEELAKIRAAEVRPGDRIVLLNEDDQRSVFTLIAERTRHLFPLDEQIHDRWEATMDAWRVRYPPQDADAREAFCALLESRQCKRVRQAMQNWLSGRTTAPEAVEDVALLLLGPGDSHDVSEAAKIIAHEMNRYRAFRRRVGRAIVSRSLARAEGKGARNRLDQEIDEVLEMCDVCEVESEPIVLGSQAAPGAELSEQVAPAG